VSGSSFGVIGPWGGFALATPCKHLNCAADPNRRMQMHSVPSLTYLTGSVISVCGTENSVFFVLLDLANFLEDATCQ